MPFPRKLAPAMVGGRRNRPRVGVQSGGIHGRGCDRRRRGIWWDRVYKRIAVQGVDFVEDTQDGVGDEFELIPDSDEEDGDHMSYVHDSDDKIVPETEVQEIADEEQIEQRQVDVDQSSLGYDSCRHFVYSFLIYVTCVVSYFF